MEKLCGDHDAFIVDFLWFYDMSQSYYYILLLNLLKICNQLTSHFTCMDKIQLTPSYSCSTSIALSTISNDMFDNKMAAWKRYEQFK